MIKLYAPLGYTINNNKGYYNADNHEELVEAFLKLADWDEENKKKIESETTEGLVKAFLENGFTIEEDAE